MEKKLNSLVKDLYATFGWTTRITAPLIGRYLYLTLKKEEERLARGWTYEPLSFYQKNEAALALEKAEPTGSKVKTQSISWVTCGNVSAPGR